MCAHLSRGIYITSPAYNNVLQSIARSYRYNDYKQMTEIKSHKMTSIIDLMDVPGLFIVWSHDDDAIYCNGGL